MTASDPPLLMTMGSNPETHIITRKSNDTEMKGLGIHMNFQGTFAYHAKTMKTKFDAMALKLRQAPLSIFLSRVFYNSF